MVEDRMITMDQSVAILAQAILAQAQAFSIQSHASNLLGLSHSSMTERPPFWLYGKLYWPDEAVDISFCPIHAMIRYTEVVSDAAARLRLTLLRIEATKLDGEDGEQGKGKGEQGKGKGKGKQGKGNDEQGKGNQLDEQGKGKGDDKGDGTGEGPTPASSSNLLHTTTTTTTATTTDGVDVWEFLADVEEAEPSVRKRPRCSGSALPYEIN